MFDRDHFEDLTDYAIYAMECGYRPGELPEPSPEPWELMPGEPEYNM